MTTLTVDSRRLTGAPETGTIKIRTSRTPIFDRVTKTTFSGTATVPLDSDGAASISLPPSDREATGPAFLYTFEAQLASGTWILRNVHLPDVETIDLADLHNVAPAPGEPTRIVKVPTGGLDGQVLVWGDGGFTWMDVPPGPKGDPGEVTTAALTAALSAKVTGSGMTVRVDTTVGTRVLLDHPGGTLMLDGDTGWRNISTSLLNGWSGSLVRLTRTGNTVSLTGRIDGTAKTGNRFYSIPDGFRPPGGLSYSLPGRIAGSDLTIVNGGHLETTYTGEFGNIFETWPTRDPWPTTLPGVPG